MIYLFFLFSFLIHFRSTNSFIYDCPNHKQLNNKQPTLEKQIPENVLKCNFLMTNPKKVINPFKKNLENYVPSRPFASICHKCAMCLTIAKEINKILNEVMESTTETAKQVEVVEFLKESIQELCSTGFYNYDLRKFKHHTQITNNFECSTHVRTKMDGHWTEKLREMCKTYGNYMDLQFLVNEHVKGSNDTSDYLCKSHSIFRDCLSLDTAPNEDDSCLGD